MFKFRIEYLVNPGSTAIYAKEYKCKAWTKWGAWKKFLKDTSKERHYTVRSVLNNFWVMRKDIRFCGMQIFNHE